MFTGGREGGDVKQGKYKILGHLKALEDTSLFFRDRDSVHMSSWTPSLSHSEWSTRGSRFMIFLTPALLCLKDTAYGSRCVFVAGELLSATNPFIFKEDQKVSRMPIL